MPSPPLPPPARLRPLSERKTSGDEQREGDPQRVHVHVGVDRLDPLGELLVILRFSSARRCRCRSSPFSARTILPPGVASAICGELRLALGRELRS